MNSTHGYMYKTRAKQAYHLGEQELRNAQQEGKLTPHQVENPFGFDRPATLYPEAQLASLSVEKERIADQRLDAYDREHLPPDELAAAEEKKKRERERRETESMMEPVLSALTEWRKLDDAHKAKALLVRIGHHIDMLVEDFGHSSRESSPLDLESKLWAFVQQFVGHSLSPEEMQRIYRRAAV